MVIRQPGRYKLVDKVAVPCDDLMEWATWIETANRRVARDEVGPCIVSTVFLGLDHNFSAVGDPLLFETMILGDGIESYQERVSTWGEAEKEHAKALEVAKEIWAKAQALLPDAWGGTDGTSHN